MVNTLILNSRGFYPRDIESPEVDAVVNEIAEVLVLRGLTKQRKILKYLILDFKYRLLENKAGWIYYSRDKNSYKFYRNTEPFKTLGVNYDPLVSILGKIKQARLIESRLGFSDEASFMTRIRPTSILHEFLNRIPETLIKPDNGVAQAIVLREKIYKKNRKGKPVPVKIPIAFEASSDTLEWAGEVRYFNKHLARHHIDLYPLRNHRYDQVTAEGLKETEIVINTNQKYLQRIFNDTFDFGGRFYGGWWQSIPGSLRPYILIDEQATVEIDYKGFHIALLYSLEGIDYYRDDANRDPYQIEGWDRSDVKLLLQIVLNTSKGNVPKAFNEARFEEHQDQYPVSKLKPLVNQFEAMHQPIAKYFYQGAGSGLQRIDSMIASRVMLSCMKLGQRNAQGVNEKFVVLPVHDSFIVQKQHKDQLAEIMKIALSETIMEMNVFEGIPLFQYVPELKCSTPIDLSEMASPSAEFYTRKEMYRRNQVIPELKYFRKSNRDKSIDLFKLDTSFNT